MPDESNMVMHIMNVKRENNHEDLGMFFKCIHFRLSYVISLLVDIGPYNYGITNIPTNTTSI